MISVPKTPEAEGERLLGLGATHLHEKDEYGVNWNTFADPEGNEFCVACEHLGI